MPTPEWEWVLSADERTHQDRVMLIREVRYEVSSVRQLHAVEESAGAQGKALLLNISSKGMLILARLPFAEMQILNVKVPSEIRTASIATLAEVVWTRPLPMLPDQLHFIGVRFLL